MASGGPSSSASNVNILPRLLNSVSSRGNPVVRVNLPAGARVLFVSKPNPFNLTIEKLLQTLDQENSFLPRTWKWGWDDRSQAVVIYKVDLAADPVKVSLAIRLRNEEADLENVTDSDVEITNQQPRIMPSLTLGQRKMDSLCSAMLLGYEDVRSEDDILKLISHLEALPAYLELLTALPGSSAEPPKSNDLPEKFIKKFLARDEKGASIQLSQDVVDVLAATIKTTITDLFGNEALALDAALPDPFSPAPPPSKKKKYSSYPKRQTLFPCQECSRSYSTAGALKNHVNNYHEKVRYTCGFCRQQFTRLRGMRCHIDLKHTGNIQGLTVTCLVCEKVMTREELIHHEDECLGSDEHQTAAKNGKP